jgi:hypothetical protein
MLCSMRQNIKGTFSLTLVGIPLLFIGRLRLVSEKGSGVIGYGVFVGPIGLVIPGAIRFRSPNGTD